VSLLRDPRTDPRPGDILRGRGADGIEHSVLIIWATDEYVGFSPEREGGFNGLCRISMEAFRRDAADATVEAGE
jgi:hypothetical protein